MADGHAFGVDQDFFDEQAQDPLTFLDGGAIGLGPQPREELLWPGGAGGGVADRDPWDERTDVGPLDLAATQRVEQWVGGAVDAGRRC